MTTTPPEQPSVPNLGEAVSKVVAEYLKLTPNQITGVHLDGDRWEVDYARSTGPGTFENRTCAISPTTGKVTLDVLIEDVS